MARQARLEAASDQELLAELKDAGKMQRFELAKEMARRKNAVFVASWRPFLSGESRDDRCLAGLILASAGEDEGLAVVLEELAASTAELKSQPALRDRQRIFQEAQQVRSFAALTLGRIGDPRAVDALIEATRDPGISSRAALSLGEIGDRRAIPALREMARQQPAERHWAGLALANLCEPEGFELLLDVARSDMHWTERRHAVIALGELRFRGAVETLAKILRGEDVHLRVAAARALGETGDPAALPALRAALDDQERTIWNEDVSVAEVAEKALRRLESTLGTSPP